MAVNDFTRITIAEYDASMTGLVAQFNGRLKAAGHRRKFPLSPLAEWLPKLPGRKLFQEYYVALEEQSSVRGGYA